jgi:uroporphyrinogen decarboxylase
MITTLADLILGSPRRIAMPVGAYVGLALTGGSVRDIVTDVQAQMNAVRALHERFHSPVILTAMDLSAEAEAFGSTIRMFENEIPAVIGRRVMSRAEIDRLPLPTPGAGRTCIHLEVAHRLVSSSGGTPVLGGLIGPFSLAARLFGVSEALEATISEPETLLCLIEKAARFLTEYALSFRAAGAAGVFMAEPAAGLLSPRGLAEFSASFVKRIVAAVQSRDFAIVLHNCGARIAHLAPTLESGAEIYHFGAPMDLPEALRRAMGEAILCGNLDPTAVLHDGTPETIHAAACHLLREAEGNPAFVLSSGCDLPPGTPLENVEALYGALARGVNSP